MIATVNVTVAMDRRDREKDYIVKWILATEDEVKSDLSNIAECENNAMVMAYHITYWSTKGIGMISAMEIVSVEI